MYTGKDIDKMNHRIHVRNTQHWVLTVIPLMIVITALVFWNGCLHLRINSVISFEGEGPTLPDDRAQESALHADDSPPPQQFIDPITGSERVVVPTEYFPTQFYRITCYGPPPYGGFPVTNRTANGMTVQAGLDLAEERGLDGICAVSWDTPWFSRRRDAEPPVIHVQGHGNYLAIDCTAESVLGTIDLYNPELSASNQWNERGVEVYEYTNN